MKQRTSHVVAVLVILAVGGIGLLAPTPALGSESAPGYMGIGFRVDPATGIVRVEHVVPGSPSAKEGVRPGDVLKSVNGADVRFPSHDAVLRFFAATTAVDQSMEMAYERSGETLQMQVRPVARPEDLDRRNAARLRCLDETGRSAASEAERPERP